MEETELEIGEGQMKMTDLADEDGLVFDVKSEELVRVKILKL